MTETTAPPTYDRIIQAYGSDGRRHFYSCRILDTRITQGWNQPHTEVLVESNQDGKVWQFWTGIFNVKTAAK